MEQSLAKVEQKELDRCESIIDNGLRTFQEVGSALLQIRDGKLYRAEYKTFEEYCQKRWGMPRQIANRYILANNTAKILEPFGTKISNIEQTRPMATLQPKEQQQVWKRAVQIAGSTPPTGEQVKAAVRELTFKPAPPIPDGNYSVVYADPPWQFANSGLEESAASHYPTMDTESICKMEIPKSKILFLWATNAMLEDAFRVLKAWGYTYKTNMVWVKNKGPSIGWYLQTRHELLLIGVRGEDTHPQEKPISIIQEVASVHSRKPEIVYSIIESMYQGPHLELFARQKHNGWEVWGNEI